MDKKNLLKRTYNKKKNNSIKWIFGSLTAIAVIGGSVVVPILGSSNSKNLNSWDNIVSIFDQNLQKWVSNSVDLGVKFDFTKKSTKNIKEVYSSQFKDFIKEQYYNSTNLGTSDYSIDLKPILSKEVFDPNLPENYGILPIRISSNNSTNQKIYFIKGFAFTKEEFNQIFKSEFINEFETRIIGILPSFPIKKDVEFQIPSFIDEGSKEIKIVGIGKEAMPNLELKALTIPNTITNIGDYAFKGSKVSVFNFSKNLSQLGKNPFVDNIEDYSINLGNNPKFSLVDNQFLIDNQTNKIITFFPVSKDFSIPDSVLEIGDSAAKNLTIKSVTFSDQTNIVNISNSSFEGVKELNQFSLPWSVKGIGESAFKGSSIREFMIPKDNDNKPSQLITIGDYAFANCKNLIGENINNKNLFYIPNSAIDVEGINIFQNSSLIDVVSLSFSNFLQKSYNDKFTNVIEQTSNPNGTILEARLNEELKSGTIVDIEKFKEIFGNQSPSNFLDAKDQTNAGDGYVIKKNIVLPNIDRSKTFNDLTIPEFIYWQEQNQQPTIYRITEVPNSAFENNSKIKNIKLPKSIVEIGNSAFKTSSLSKIIFSPGSNIKLIGDEAFASTKLQSIDLTLTLANDETTTLGSGVFSNNSQLNNVIWNPKYKNIPNNTFLNNIALTNFDFVANNIQQIGENAFKNTGLVSVSFNNSIVTIGEGAFENSTKLRTLTFDNSSSISQILNNTFNGCTSLDTINSWPTQLTSIGNFAFNGIAISNLINLPNSLNVIGNNAFSNNRNLLKVTLPMNISTLGDSVFENDSLLNDLKIPESVISVGSNVLANCAALKAVYISYNQYYGVYSDFVKTKLEIGKLPTTRIYYQELINDNSDFEFTRNEQTQTVIIKKYKGSASSLSIPEFVRFSNNANVAYHVIGIGDNAFKGATSIINLSLPASIREIGANAFENTSSLSQLDLSKTNLTTIPIGAFKGSGVLNVELPKSVATILDSAFENASKLSIINLSNVTTIGNSAFKGASSLFNINSFSQGLTQINDSAFEGTSSLQLDAIPNTITSIGNNAFANSKFNIEELVIPNSIRSIGEGAFSGLNYVKSIRFEENNNSLKTLPTNAFNGLSNLQNFDISSTKITTLSNSVLAYNRKLTTIKLSSTINTLGNSVFEGCSELENLSLPTSINRIGQFIAKDCPKMKFVVITPSQMLDSNLVNNLNSDKGTSSYRIVSRVGTPGSEISTEGFIISIYDGQGIITGYTNKNATSIVIPEFVQSSFLDEILPIRAINQNVFANMTSLNSLSLSSNLFSISSGAFKSAINLHTITIPNDSSLQVIGDNAFENCNKLANISSLPNLVSIGHSAFKSTKLANLDFISKSKNLQKIGNSAFESTTITGNIDFSIWKKLQAIGSRAFSNTRISSIDMSQSANNITLMDYVFSNMNNLTSFKFNPKLTQIPLGLLSGCTSLTSIQWPNSIEVISSLAFADTAINLLPPAISFNKIKFIGSFAFKNTRITNINLTESNLIETIHSNAFSNMPNLVSVIIPNASSKFVLLESNTFANNPELLNVILPPTLKTIADNAFNNLAKIEQILLPSSISFIGENTFNNLPKLKRIGVQINQNESLLDLKKFLPNKFADMFVYTIKENEQSKDNSKLFEVQYNGNSATLISYTGNNAKVYIPTYIVNDDGLWFKVTNVKNTVFQAKKDIIQEVIMDKNLPDFNANSLFKDSVNLASVTLSENQILYSNMFLNTPKLKTVNIKNKNITNIPYSCFFQSGIEDLDLSTFNNLTSLNMYCFEQSQITNLMLPSSITNIVHRSFAKATKLSIINLIVENNITIEENAFEDAINLVQFNISSKNWKASSITIKDYAFRRTFISSFNLSSFQTVNLIGKNIFEQAYNLRTIWLPNVTKAQNNEWWWYVIYNDAYKINVYYPSNFMSYDQAKQFFGFSDDEIQKYINLNGYNNVK